MIISRDFTTIINYILDNLCPPILRLLSAYVSYLSFGIWKKYGKVNEI